MTDGVNVSRMPRARRSVPLSPPIITGIIGGVDTVIVFAIGTALYFWYVGWDPDTVSRYLVVLVSNAGLIIGLFYFVGLYDFDTVLAPGASIGKVAAVCIMVFMIMLVWAFALKISANFSRVWFFFSLVGQLVVISTCRVAVRSLIRASALRGEIARRIAVVGCTEQGARFIKALRTKDAPWNEIVGVFDDRQDKERTQPEFADLPVVGNLGDLIDFARRERLDDIVVALPWYAVKRLMAIIARLRELPVNVRLSTDMIGYEFPNREYSSLAEISLLNVSPKPLTDWKVVLKVLEDKVLALLALAVCGLPMVLIAIAVKLDSPGPVLFKQRRYGFNNEEFNVLKFRTMIHNPADRHDGRQAQRDDPRVTRLGRFLRRSSLDELPQIINVLKGDMSMVGPRPLPVSQNMEYAAVVDGYFARHRVLPGITGWAQINGHRGGKTIEEMRERLEYDVYYIENWSLFLDLWILVKTVAVVPWGKNAY